MTMGTASTMASMVEALGGKVLKLVRTAIGPLQIAKLQIGKYRVLMPAVRPELTPSATGPRHAR